jgi:hypothetical protein
MSVLVLGGGTLALWDRSRAADGEERARVPATAAVPAEIG